MLARLDARVHTSNFPLGATAEYHPTVREWIARARVINQFEIIMKTYVLYVMQCHELEITILSWVIGRGWGWGGGGNAPLHAETHRLQKNNGDKWFELHDLMHMIQSTMGGDM